MRHIRFDAHYWGYILLPDPTGRRTWFDRGLGVLGIRRTDCEDLLSPVQEPRLLGHIPGELPGGRDDSDSGIGRVGFFVGPSDDR